MCLNNKFINSLWSIGNQSSVFYNILKKKDGWTKNYLKEEMIEHAGTTKRFKAECDMKAIVHSF